MSRYILFPGSSKDLFVLVSDEDFQQTKLLEVPDELFDITIYNEVKSREKLNNLLYKLSQCRIFKTVDGFVKDKNKLWSKVKEIRQEYIFDPNTKCSTKRNQRGET